MKNFLVLVFSTSLILSHEALAIRDEENYQSTDQRYVYSETDESAEDAGTVEYYKPPSSRRIRIPSSKYEDPTDLNNEEPNYPQGYELVSTTENYPYEIADYNPPAVKRIRTTKKPVIVEQFLKEVTPTTKIAYQQYAKLNNQRRRIDNIRDQIEESQTNDVKKVARYQYVLPAELQQRSHISQPQYPYELPESKSMHPQQISELNRRPQYAIFPSRIPGHQKLVEIDPSQHPSQSSIFVSTSLPNKPVRKTVKPKPSPVDDDVDYYSQLQQYQQQLQLKQQTRQKQQLQRLKQQQIQQQQERRQKIQQQLIQEQQLLQQQILQKQIQQQRLQESDLRLKTELQQPSEVKYQSKLQKFPKEDAYGRDAEDIKYYEQQTGQYELENKPVLGTKPEVIQFHRNSQLQRKPGYKNSAKQNPALPSYTPQQPWKPIISKDVPDTNNYYYQSVAEESEPQQESSSPQQDELTANKFVSYQQSNVQDLDKYQQQALRHAAKTPQAPKTLTYLDATSDPQPIRTKAIPYQLQESQEQKYQQIVHPSVHPEYVEAAKNIPPKAGFYQTQNEDARVPLYEQQSTAQQPLLKYQKARLQLRGRPQTLPQSEEGQQEGLEIQYFKPQELPNYKSNDQETISFKPNIRNDARLYRNLRPTVSYQDSY